VLSNLLATLEKGDVLMTSGHDRLGRSLVHLVKVLAELEARGIGFATLDGVSTHGATGKLVLHILGSVVQFEHQLLIERTMAGFTGGRRRKMTPQDAVAPREHMAEASRTHVVAQTRGAPSSKFSQYAYGVGRNFLRNASDGENVLDVEC